jgi:hypothetical protein
MVSPVGMERLLRESPGFGRRGDDTPGVFAGAKGKISWGRAGGGIRFGWLALVRKSESFALALNRGAARLGRRALHNSEYPKSTGPSQKRLGASRDGFATLDRCG